MSADPLAELLAGFAVWCEAQGYAASTTRQALIDVRRLFADCDAGRRPPARLRHQGLRLLRFAREVGAAEALAPCLAWVNDAAAKAGWNDYQRGRRKPAQSVDDLHWVQLWRALRADPSLEARVLEVQAVTGLRVGDVLRIELAALKRGVRDNVLRLIQKGGRVRELHLLGPLAESFQRLHQGVGPAQGERLYDVMGGTYQTAYKRVQRALDRAARAIELPGRAHTHRLRRTVAMQALRATRDVGLVQQLLGHASPTTTQRYLDEERPGEVSELAGQVFDRFLGGEDGG